MHRPVADLHFNVPYPDVFPLREPVGHFTTDHPFDDPLLADRFSPVVIDGLNRRSVTNYGYFIRHIGNFIQLMGDDNHRHPLFFEAEHQIQQCTGIFFIQRGRRLVQNQQLCFFRQCLCYFDKLLFTGTNGFHLNF